MDCKKSLRKSEHQKMNPVECVESATKWADSLVRFEARGPGDLDNAMRRVERRHGVPYSALWALRYRKPKDVMASIYFRLRDAFEAERERQIRLMEHQIEIEKAAGNISNSVHAAEALAREAGSDSSGETT